ncbi:hypothetical protein NIES2101_22855 [Calothrix sp. HK-06]|nr:hypothetical protein NIES2101_22855 [Calothrix sp. HK-06]
MKDIIRFGKQLLSMFLVLVASSVIFLSFPTGTAPLSIDRDTINKEENQILKSDKPVKASKPDEPTVILTPQEAVRQANTSAKKRESFSKGFFSESKTSKETAPSSK